MKFNFNETLFLFQKGKSDEAKNLCIEALKEEPNNFDFLHLLGVITFREKDYKKSEEVISKAIKIKPNHVEIYDLYAFILLNLRKFDLAIKSWDEAIKLKPDYAEAYNNRGNILFELGKIEDSLESYEKAIKIKPDYADAYNNMGNPLRKLNKINAALKSCEKAIEFNPNHIEALNNKGNILFALGKIEDSLKSYNAVIKLSPNNPQIYNNLGIVLNKLDKKNSALESYEKAIKIKPDYAEAHYNKGNILLELNKNNAALNSYKKALETKTYIKTLLGTILNTKLKMCDWTNLNKDLQNFKDEITNPKKIPNPFFLLPVIDSPKIQKHAAEKWFINEYTSLNNNLEEISKRKKNKKIKIGYYSADFREHAVGQLIANLFELHNKSNFEIFGFYFGPDVNDYTHKRISKAVDKFINVSLKNETEIAKLSRNFQIDIAVDLMGHTERSRFKIFAERCAPIQVSYLGYPGTLGTNCIDYLIADKTLIPKENQQYYSEKIIYLPNTYLVNDSTKKLSKKKFTRENLGLPKNNFVFCCFNQSQKILPEIFNIWMKILKKVNGSVLWLFETNEVSCKNLKQEATKVGIDANRIIFAKRLPLLEEHLARYKAADLFLDTFPYTAHSTCADSLRAGLPVLTLQGHSFASRVSSSLLEAVGLKELITHSLNEYENMALDLASNLSKLKNIKKKLEDNKNTTPLFNTKLFTNNIEKAYVLMFEKYIKGEKNDNIEI
tara:strand:+ start:96 stop:2273 length:2178 start_codon:yes stop_codon:yes gene_type:complete